VKWDRKERERRAACLKKRRDEEMMRRRVSMPVLCVHVMPNALETKMGGGWGCVSVRAWRVRVRGA